MRENWSIILLLFKFFRFKKFETVMKSSFPFLKVIMIGKRKEERKKKKENYYYMM